MAQPAVRSSRQRSESADRILAAARELFGRDGYQRTTLKQIAERCGLTDAAVLYHFRSKREILEALLVPPEYPTVVLPSEWDAGAFARAVVDLFYSFEGHWDLVRLIAVEGWFYEDPAMLGFGGSLERSFSTQLLPTLEKHFPSDSTEISYAITTFLQGFLLDRLMLLGPDFDEVISLPETRAHLERCVSFMLPPVPETPAGTT